MYSYEQAIQETVNEKLAGLTKQEMFDSHIDINDIIAVESKISGYSRKCIRKDLFPCMAITRADNNRVWSDKQNRQPIGEQQRKDSERRTGIKSEASEIDELVSFLRTVKKGW